MSDPSITAQDDRPDEATLWHYFVSYAHPRGSGQIHIARDRPVDDYDQVIQMRECIIRDGGMTDPVILFYSLLSGPTAFREAATARPDGQPTSLLLWSVRHHAWWKPVGFGYTADMPAAGRFTPDEADHHCRWDYDSERPGSVKVTAPSEHLLASVEAGELMRFRVEEAIAAATKAGPPQVEPYGEVSVVERIVNDVPAASTYPDSGNCEG